MKVLVVGGGGREHALVWKLSQNPRISSILCAPGNAGIASLAECVPVSADDIDGICALAQIRGVDLVVVAPDDPLAAGLVDALEALGIRAFGPKKNAAILEASKSFSKDLMQKNGIPTARYVCCDSAQDARRALAEFALPVVIKADGLALGKGVYICQSVQDCEHAIQEIMEENRFGISGNRVVIEEFLRGPELSLLAFCDGETVRPMISAQDHKRIFDNDLGPNTGGMGAFSPSNNMTPALFDQLMEDVVQPTVKAMNDENRPFQGVLYFGIILCQDGPKVLEYNARFGDPETQAVLPLMQSDLLEAMEACIDGKLDSYDLRFSSQAACCVILASAGYPGDYEKGRLIQGLGDLDARDDILVFHSGTALDQNGDFVTNGGRVLGITGLGDTLADATAKAYEGVSKIHFEGMQYRCDIGEKM